MRCHLQRRPAGKVILSLSGLMAVRQPRFFWKQVSREGFRPLWTLLTRGAFSPSGLPDQRAFGPLDSHLGVPGRGSSLAGVTAHDGCAATRCLRLAAAAAGRNAASAGAGKGLCGHHHFAFDFRLWRTRHWRGVALCTPCRLLWKEVHHKISSVAFTLPCIR